jgi:hypothetical protein
MTAKAEMGLGQLPVRLTIEQAKILAAHQKLNQDLSGIVYPKSGRWEEMETALAVLQALEGYLSATFDTDAGDNIIIMSPHTELVRDIVTHFRQAKSGTIDRRLAHTKEGSAGAASDDTSAELKKSALIFVDLVAKQERANGTKNPVAIARKRVARAFESLGITIQTSRSGPPQEITATNLESWEKRPPEGRVSRSK